MLRERYNSDKIFEQITALMPRMDPILAKIDAYLDEELVVLIREDLSRRHPKTLVTGRNSTPVEVIIRLLVVKRLYHYSYEETERYVKDSLVLRQFCCIYLNPVPDDTTLMRQANLIQPETLERFNARLTALAQAAKITKGRKLRTDGNGNQQKGDTHMEYRRRNSYRLTGHNYADSSYAYFVTLDTKIKHVRDAQIIDPLAPFTSCRALGQQANDSLLFYRAQGKLLIFAYSIMPNHVHILTSPLGGANLSTILGSYESYVTQRAWEYGVIGKLWQRSFYDHILCKHDDAQRIIAYILNNPVNAGLVAHWQDWPWCGTPDTL